MTSLIRFLTPEEKTALEDDAVSRGFYRNDRRVFLPGYCWYDTHIFDPFRDPNSTKYQMIKDRNSANASYLSLHYWNNWSTKRPPISVVCPNGEVWEIDRKSSNGSGWTVTGEFPNITCSPSIVVYGYHGFLQDGVFTADLEGRGPIGIVREINCINAL